MRTCSAIGCVELDAMRTRIRTCDTLLADHLRDSHGEQVFDFIRTNAACFRCSACRRAAVERLREQHHIYMTGDSRMNLAGIMPHNVALCGGGHRRSSAGSRLAGSSAWLRAVTSAAESCMTAMVLRFIQAEALGRGVRLQRLASRPAISVP